ncbi:MAG: hypothetical protein JWM87_2760 [Candidatus Eremiobacteraeota bacterium]|nr:hypothetical protein [Candidatus Eremiobacteraeota bacterium]
MIRWILFSALMASSFACSGCGINWLGDQSVCIDTDTTTCPIPQTTDPPTPEPNPNPTRAPGCVDAARLLFPSPGANTIPSNYAGTMYITVTAGEIPGSFLALYVGQTDPATQTPHFEIGTALQPVTGDIPSYVATPPPGFAGVYSSSNLPLMPAWGTGITLVDSRAPEVCPSFTFATLNVKDVRRLVRGSLAGATR